MTHDERCFLIDGQRWMRIIAAPQNTNRPALFLDRDGVMIEERHYLSDPAEVAFIPGCCEVLRRARARGLAIIVVTNQSGIGRGYFSWRDYSLVEDRFLELLEWSGVSIDAVLANSAVSREHCWRKPNPGMLISAAEELKINVHRSLIVGDKASDLKAGRDAGLLIGIHVLTGHGKSEADAARLLVGPDFHVECLNAIHDLGSTFDRFLV